VLFAEFPDGLTVAGMVMIVLAGVLSLRNRPAEFAAQCNSGLEAGQKPS
jgi:hypothetical protein